MIAAEKTSVNQANLDVLLSSPRPLYSPHQQLALFFSAKAGCTWAVKWFFYQINMLDAALFYRPWIHDYRIDVFYQSRDYQKNIHQLLTDKNTNIIKVVRNPYSRAVSSYIFACRATYADREMSKFLDREINKENKFSFEEFIDYLSVINLKNCEVHHRLQVHPAEEQQLIKPTYVVKLENSLEDIRRVEFDLDLKKSNFEQLRKSEHHTSKVEYKEYVGDRSFTFIESNKVSVPSTIAFYNDKLQQRVAELYQIDFEYYGYNMNNLPSI